MEIQHQSHGKDGDLPIIGISYDFSWVEIAISGFHGDFFMNDIFCVFENGLCP
jgi:hypothetical protein